MNGFPMKATGHYLPSYLGLSSNLISLSPLFHWRGKGKEINKRKEKYKDKVIPKETKEGKKIMKREIDVLFLSHAATVPKP